MSELPRSTDLFVIGGGPGGLAAAIAARRRGMDVTVADHAVPPIDKACGEGIMPDGVAAAEALGIDLRTASPRAFRGIRFCEGEESVAASFPEGHGYGLRRIALHNLMVEHARSLGVRMAWGVHIEGLRPEGVAVAGELVRAGWVVGADGGRSNVRAWAGLDAARRDSRRFGFRRHYRMAPWTDYMEIHWADGCQLYITPVAEDEVCVVLISRDPRLRLDAALPRFPQVARRLRDAEGAPERGGVSASRRLKAVCRGRVALLGDASGSVDAITGEGLCLLFQQAVSLAEAIEARDLELYQAAHRRIGRRPEFMADLMLMLENRGRLRRRSLRAMASDPRLFARMLAMHVGRLSSLDFLTNGLAFGRRLLTL